MSAAAPSAASAAGRLGPRPSRSFVALLGHGGRLRTVDDGVQFPPFFFSAARRAASAALRPAMIGRASSIQPSLNR